MKTAYPDEDQLFDEAVDLMIRLRSDPDNSVTLETIQRWRQRGPEYERAWSEAAEIGGMAGKVLGEERQAGPAMTRRKLLAAAPLLAGALAGGSYLAARSFGPHADFASAAAEFRDVTLADGSRATLGPDSAIALNMTEGKRGVSLLQGMAYFDVKEDAGRPFSVRADSLTASATGAAFEIGDNADFLTLSVGRGDVTATGPWSEAGSGLSLAAGEWLNFDGKASVATGERDPAQVAAWREGLVVAEKEPVSAVVARIARWRHGRVVMLSPWLGRQKVSGVFDLRDPVLALEAAVQPYGGRVREVSPLLAVVSLI